MTSLGCSVLDEKVANWLEWDKNEETREEIRQLAEAGDAESLRARMLGRLLFGTAGIRVRMEGGFARLNDLTIIQVTHGFARHISNEFKEDKVKGVAIGYDGRRNSKRFAELAANVFIRNGIAVYLFSEVVPTPLVSWAVIHFKCCAGLMVTASHNPKEDNGYKAYWANGAQFIGPHDEEVIRLRESEPEPRPEYWQTEGLTQSPLFHWADRAIETYFDVEREHVHFRSLNESSPLKMTYSAFHGVGFRCTQRMIRQFGFPAESFFSVLEQQDPDPDFPTVPFPNPEEGLKVLNLCIKRADETKSDIILANDPDADRLQLAERKTDESWQVFTGNEMGTLLTWWTWMNWDKAQCPISEVFFLNSAVSSQIVRTIAKAEGFQNEVTLTGFKWMGNKAHELRLAGKRVPLSWEESIGFMPGHSLDKDGVLAAGIFAEMAAWLRSQKSSLLQQLFEIYHRYGFHLVRSSYWMVPSPAVTKHLFSTLREDLKYPTHIGEESVQFVRDLTVGYDNEQPDNKPVLPLSTSSEMVTFTLANGSVATLRASGTEPKIKYYVQLKTAPGKEQDKLDGVTSELEQLEKDVVQTLLQPQRFGLLPRNQV